MARTLIQGGWAVGYQAGEHRLLRDGQVVWEDDRILYVGRSFPGQVDTRINVPGKIIAPGFVNLHAIANIDIQTMMLDHAAVPFNKPEEFVAQRRSLAPQGDALQVSAEFAIAGLLKGGSTTFATVTAMALNTWSSPAEEARVLAETAGKLGARAYISHNYQSGVKYRAADRVTQYRWDEHAGELGLEQATRFVQDYHNRFDGRVQALLFPYTAESCSRELLRATRAAADRLGVRIHIHIGEYLDEFHRMLARTGKTPVAFLDDAGLVGPDTILTHMVYTSAHVQSGFPYGEDRDLKLIGERGAHIAHCPLVLARVGTMLNSFQRYRGYGINIGIGTDTFPPDMFEEMRYASLFNKVLDQDRAAASAADIFTAATVGGANALGRDDLGRLAPGAQADVIVVDLNTLEAGPLDDPIQMLVHCATRRDVETVFVAGRAVVENRKIVGLDESELLAQSRTVYQQLQSSIAQEYCNGVAARTVFPLSFSEWQ